MVEEILNHPTTGVIDQNIELTKLCQRYRQHRLIGIFSAQITNTDRCFNTPLLGDGGGRRRSLLAIHISNQHIGTMARQIISNRFADTLGSTGDNRATTHQGLRTDQSSAPVNCGAASRIAPVAANPGSGCAPQ